MAGLSLVLEPLVTRMLRSGKTLISAYHIQVVLTSPFARLPSLSAFYRGGTWHLLCNA
jgi:hypothetical protein